MTGMNFFSGSGETERLAKKILLAAVLWLLALLVFLAALAQFNRNKAMLDDADSVLNAATQLKAYNVSADSSSAADASLTSLTDVINAAGLSDRVSQFNSNGGETLVRADRVYPDELEKLVSMLSAKGMQISSAEIRAANSNGERLLFIKLSVGGAER